MQQTTVRRHWKHRASLALLLLLCVSAQISATAGRALLSSSQEFERANGRKLHTALLIAKDQQQKWRGLMNALVGAMVTAFTQESLDAAGQLANTMLAPDSSQQYSQPVAQLIQLPPNGPPSGIALHTDTPVEVGAPVTVDTPVKQSNVQWGGR